MSKISNLIELEYPAFVKELKELIKEDKINSVLSTYKKDVGMKKFKFSKGNIIAGSLIPSQQELVFEYSLHWALVGSDLIRLANIQGGGPVLVKKPIVILNETYVIDGHHAWIEAAAFNPDSKIVVYNITVDEPPIKVLKIIQLAIASVIHEIPSSNSKGTNMFNVSLKKFTSLVKNDVIKKVLDLFDMSYIELASMIFKNIKSLKKPIKKAPTRDIMPQVSKAKGYDKALAEHASFNHFIENKHE